MEQNSSAISTLQAYYWPGGKWNMSRLNQQTEILTRLGVKGRLLIVAFVAVTLAASVFVLKDRYQQAATSRLWQKQAQGYPAQIAGLKENDQLGLLLFTTDYCYPCQELDRQLKKLDALAADEGTYSGFRVNAFQSTEGSLLAQKYEVNTFPCVVVTDSDGNELERYSLPGEWEHMSESLEILAALRVSPKSQAEKLPLKKSKLQPLEGEIAPSGTVLGLVVAEVADYGEARRLARLRSIEWSQEVWIHPGDSGKFELVLGAFNSKKEAKIALKMMKTLDHTSGRVVKMPKDPVSYPMQEASGLDYPQAKLK